MTNKKHSGALTRIRPDAVLPYAVAPTSTIGAQTDRDAIQTWLAASTGRSKHTFLSYRREASRFLMFIQSFGLALSAVTIETIHGYFSLLANPPQTWCMPTDRTLERLPTQCLKGGLSAPSIAHTRVVLLRLYRYLQDAGYLQHNPVALAFRTQSIEKPMHEKALEPDAWVFFWRWLLVQEQEACALTREARLRTARNRWLCALLYHSGLRRSSVAAGRMSGLSRRRIDGRDHWRLTVPSKGGRLHTVMLSPHLWVELLHYRQQMGLVGEPTPDEDEPLVCNIRGCRQAIGERAIGWVFEQLTHQAAKTCQDAHIAGQIQRLTAHGLRHTHGTHRLMSGASLASTQASLGHRDPKTTMIYAKVAEDTLRLHAEQMDNFINNIAQNTTRSLQD
jgi:integrase/recombinase XerC